MPLQKINNNDSSDIIQYIKKISELMLEKKALNIKTIDVRKLTSLTDFFIICSSESEPQTRAITDNIYKNMKKTGIKAWHIEGYENLDWVLLDYINIVVHIFSKKSRSYYDLERLWADGKITKIEDEE